MTYTDQVYRLYLQQKEAGEIIVTFLSFLHFQHFKDLSLCEACDIMSSYLKSREFLVIERGGKNR